MVTVAGGAPRYTCTVDSKIVATYVSLTVKKPSEWPITEQMDMGSCAIFAKLIVVKLPGPIPQDECLLNTGSHWSSIELASARYLISLVCKHVEGL